MKIKGEKKEKESKLREGQSENCSWKICWNRLPSGSEEGNCEKNKIKEECEGGWTYCYKNWGAKAKNQEDVNK